MAESTSVRVPGMTRAGRILLTLAVGLLLTPAEAAGQERLPAERWSGEPAGVPWVPASERGGAYLNAGTSWRTRAVVGALVGCGGVGYMVASNAQRGEKFAAAATGCALGLVPGAILGVAFLPAAPRMSVQLHVSLP